MTEIKINGLMSTNIFFNILTIKPNAVISVILCN